MKDLADRLEEALRRAGGNARELSRRAGMNPTQFGVTLKRVKELRFGDGAEGLARGVGLTVVVALDLPAGVEVADDHDGVAALRDARGTLTEIARHLLAPYPHDERHVRALAERLKEKSPDNC